MKTPAKLVFVLFFGLNSWLFADVDNSPVRTVRSAEQLDQLLGPVALYPDALLGLVLPAATFSSDIVLAARYLENGGDPAKSEAQPWDDSVQGLARYPEVVKWMDENLAWTMQLGEAFIAQPEDVMSTVQRLRERAQSAGTLTSTPQQQVVVTNQIIEIVPTQPEVIYVPYYDPAVVYVRPSHFHHDPFFTFSIGFSTGAWLAYTPDWHHRHIVVIDRPYRGPHWHRPGFPRRPAYTMPIHRPWRPHPGYVRPTRPLPNHPVGIISPHPYRHDRDRPGNPPRQWDRRPTPAGPGNQHPSRPPFIRQPDRSPGQQSSPQQHLNRPPAPHQGPQRNFNRPPQTGPGSNDQSSRPRQDNRPPRSSPSQPGQPQSNPSSRQANNHSPRPNAEQARPPRSNPPAQRVREASASSPARSSEQSRPARSEARRPADRAANTTERAR